MSLSDRQLRHFLSRTPFIDTAELALILGEPHATVHRALTGLLADGIVGRVSYGTAHLPASQRYYLTTDGVRETAGVLGFETPTDFVHAYPVSREWLTLLIRRTDAVASVYRLAASLSPGIRSLRSHVEFHRRGRFDATITLHDGRTFGVVRQGLALRRRSLYDRLRAIAGYDYARRPSATLILTPSVWELRLTARFCINPNPPMDRDGRREDSGRGEGVTGAMIRARIWVDGRLAGGLQAFWGAPMAAYSGCGERDGGIGHGKRRSRTGLARVCGDVGLAGGSVADGRRQAGSGMARSRARARLNCSSQGQRRGRCRVNRRAERVIRPAKAKTRRLRVLVVTIC